MALKVAQRCTGVSYFLIFFGGGGVLREKSPFFMAYIINENPPV
jgi:hypothetical protein